jgi:F0F1-type ATP synthase beta subunit
MRSSRVSGANGFKKTVVIKTILESLTQNSEFVEMFVGVGAAAPDPPHREGEKGQGKRHHPPT